MRFKVILLLSILSFSVMGCKMQYNEREAAWGGGTSKLASKSSAFKYTERPKLSEEYQVNKDLEKILKAPEIGNPSKQLNLNENIGSTLKSYKSINCRKKIIKIIPLKNNSKLINYRKTTKFKSTGSLVSDNNLMGWISVLSGLIAFVLPSIFLKFIFGGLAIALGYFSKKMHWGFMADILGMIAIVLGLFAILGGLINQLLNILILVAVLLILWILIRYLLSN